MQEAPLAVQLDDPDFELHREFGAVVAPAAVPEHAPALGPHDLAASRHLAFVGGNQEADVAAEHLAAVDPVRPDGGFVGVEYGAVERGHEERVRGLGEQRPIALLGRAEAVAEAVVGERDAGDPGDGVECGLGQRQSLDGLLEEAQQRADELFARPDRDRTERGEARGPGKRQDPFVDVARDEVLEDARAAGEEQAASRRVASGHSLEPEPERPGFAGHGVGLEMVAGLDQQVADAGRAEDVANQADGPVGKLFERARLLADTCQLVECPEAVVQ